MLDMVTRLSVIFIITFSFVSFYCYSGKFVFLSVITLMTVDYIVAVA